MKPSNHLLTLLIAALILCGCETTRTRTKSRTKYSGKSLTAAVTVFHNLTDEPKTYSIIPYDQQQGSLEHRAYALHVAGELEKQGWSQASDIESADCVVLFTYSIKYLGTQTFERQVYQRPPRSSKPISAPAGGNAQDWQNYYNKQMSRGFKTDGTYRTVTEEIDQYLRKLNLKLLDGEKFQKGDLHPVLEGEVESTGSTGHLAAVMPYLVEAMFSDFLGPSGSVREISVPMD